MPQTPDLSLRGDSDSAIPAPATTRRRRRTPRKGSRTTGPTLRTRALPSGRVQAYGIFNGRFVAFGMADDPATRVRFAEFKARWEACGRKLPDAPPSAGAGPTVAVLLNRYEEFAATYYRRANGSPSGRQEPIRAAHRQMRELYGSSPARSFDLLALKAVREAMIAAGLARKTVNARVQQIRRTFSWGAEERLVPAAVAAELRELRHLQPGRSAAHETKPRQPVSLEHVEATLAHLGPKLRALVLAMWHSGMRCGEAVQLRSKDVDMNGRVWIFRPPQHKGAWREKPREIDLGPNAQEALRAHVKLDPDAYWISPADVVAEQREERAAARATPRWPSHEARYTREHKARKAQHKDPQWIAAYVDKHGRKPPAGPGIVYDTRAIAHAIRRACERADVPRWSPHQLRHAALSRVRAKFGLEAAIALGGHGSPVVTESYTREAERALARKIAEQVG